VAGAKIDDQYWLCLEGAIAEVR